MHGVVCVLAAFICQAYAATVAVRISTSNTNGAGGGSMEVRAYNKVGASCLIVTRSFPRGETGAVFPQTCSFGDADVWRIEVHALTSDGWRARTIEINDGSGWAVWWNDFSQGPETWVDTSYALMTTLNWYKPERVTVLFYSGMSESPNNKTHHHTQVCQTVRATARWK